jgi:peptidoglycan/LPS O-acetylase OafA/YrhL
MIPRRQTEYSQDSLGGSAEDPVVEALRGLAALMVLTTHYAYMLTNNPASWGFASTGVDLFFVLSGFVFAPYFFGKELAVGRHLVRRFFRLYPLYVAALLLYAVLKLPEGGDWQYFITHLLMGHTLKSTDVAFFYNPAFWSLPAEVEYYLALPLLVWLARFIGLAGLLAVSTASHMLLLAVADPGEPVNSARAIAMVHTPGLLIEFLLGSASYWASRRHPGVVAIWTRLLLGLSWLLTVAVAYSVLIASDPGPIPGASIWVSGNVGVAAAAGYAAVVSAVVCLSRSIGIASRRLFLRMGQLSYGVYLFHNASPKLMALVNAPTAGLSGVLLALVITFLLAWATHHAIERPLRRFGREISQRLGR